MKKSIHQIVRDIFLKDELAVESFKKDLLNTNAYAKQIHKKVEKLAHKKVKVNTITVAINRLKKSIDKLDTTSNNKVKINGLDIITPIIVSIYEANDKILVASLNLASDTKTSNFVHLLHFNKELLIVGYKPQLAKTIATWNAPLFAEYKCAIVKIELPEKTSDKAILDILAQNKINLFTHLYINNSLILAIDHNDINKILKILND